MAATGDSEDAQGENPGGEDWRDVCRFDDIADGTAIEAVLGPLVVAVFRDGENIHALDGLCAHQGGPVAKGELSKTDRGKTCVTCPWHGWQYELETGIQTVNRQPLQRVFPARIRDGRIEVDVAD